MMIDWISGSIEATEGLHGHPLYDTGSLLRIDPQGSCEKLSSLALPVEGSHDSRLTVRSPRGHDLYLSGNPTKYFQGHNLFGPLDPLALFFAMGIEVREKIGLFPSVSTWESYRFSGPRMSRLDITRSYRFPGGASQAREWLRAYGATGRSKHGAASVSRESTVYYGKQSTRWTMKLYHKADELESRKKGHKLSERIPYEYRRKLQEWAQGVVRFELTLRRPELEKIHRTNDSLHTVWQTYFDRITWNENSTMSDQNLLVDSLPQHLKITFHAWRSGADLRAVLTTPTFYRQRREIMAATGVDIAVPPAEKPTLPESPGASLPEAGWDPEPLEGLAVDIDPTVAGQYHRVTEAPQVRPNGKNLRFWA